MQSLGVTIVFGTILAKLTRVYYIFRNPTSKKKVYIYILYNFIYSIITTTIIVLDNNRQAPLSISSYHCVYYDTITNNWDSYSTNKA